MLFEKDIKIDGNISVFVGTLPKNSIPGAIRQLIVRQDDPIIENGC